MGKRLRSSGIGEFGMGGAEIVLGDDRLRRRRIEELQIGLRLLARALGVDVGVDHRHRRLGEDRQRRRDNLELVLAEFLAGEEGVVFPGDQHVAEAALGEGDGRAARAGVEHRRVLVDRRDEVLGLGLVAAELLFAVGPGGEIVPARAAGGLGVGGDHRNAGLGEIVPVVDALGIALVHEKHDRRGVGRRIVRQPLLPVGRDLAGLGGDGVDVGGERQRHDVGSSPSIRGGAVDLGVAVAGSCRSWRRSRRCRRRAPA